MLKQLLQVFQGCAAGRLARYEGTRLVESAVVDWPDKDQGEVRLHFGGADWVCTFRAEAAAGEDQAVDLCAIIRVMEGAADEISFSAVFQFQAWSQDNYVLMPAAVYNGNRFPSRQTGYPPLASDPADRGVNAPIVITDVPRLNVEAGESQIRLLTGDLTTPAIGFFDPRKSQGFWLLTEQSTRAGTTGLEIEETADRCGATIRVSAPGMRGKTRYTICDMGHACEDRGMNFGPGDELRLRMRLYGFPCEKIQGLFEHFAYIRKDLSGPVVLRHGLPLSVAWEMIEAKYNRENWQDRYGFYKVGVDESKYSGWQVGWVGGGMSSYPMLFEGSAISWARAWQTIEFMIYLGQAPSGLFRGIAAAHKGYLRWFGDGFEQPGTRHWHLIRKSADALYFLMKQFDLVRKQEPERDLPEHWRIGAQRCADAFTRLWERYGQFGQFVDEVTGEIMVGNSSAAGIAPGGLALAARMLDTPRYLEVARESAQDFYQRFIEKGYTVGGPGEIMQNPDSESAAGLLESFVVLYEETGEPVWLIYARAMAYQLSTWVMSYDFTFPEASLFGRLGMKSAGSVWANVQNKHSAPGYCTLSGDALFKLYRATKDPFFLE